MRKDAEYDTKNSADKKQENGKREGNRGRRRGRKNGWMDGRRGGVKARRENPQFNFRDGKYFLLYGKPEEKNNELEYS